MAHTVTRRSLPVPDETPDTPDVPRDITALANALGLVATYNTGTLAALPSSGMIIGDLYRANDDLYEGPNGTLYEYTGSVASGGQGWVRSCHQNDAVAGTASARTLGTGSQQAAAGNDGRISARTAPAKVAVGTNVNIASPGATLDGATMSLNDRVLLFAQTDPTQNGLYVWNGAAVAMTRTSDALVTGMETTIFAGNTYASARFVFATQGTITLGTTALTWQQGAIPKHAAQHRRVAGVVGNDPILEVASPGWQDVLQPGVMASGDCVVGLTLNANGTIGTGNISGGVVWIPDSTGFLRRHIAPSVNLFSSPPAGYPNVPGLGVPAAGNYDYVLLKLWATFNDWGLGPTYQWTYTNQVSTPNVYTTLEQAEGSVMGAPVNPDGRSVCIFEFLMRSAAGTNGNWTSIASRDKRPWATGAHIYVARQSGSSYTRSASTLALIDATNLQRRVEVSGLWPLRIRLRTLAASSITTIQASFGVFMDGAELAAMRKTWVTPNTTAATTFDGEWIIPTSVLPAGSHLFGPSFAGDGTNTLTLSQLDNNQPLEFEIYEDMRASPNLYNGTA